MVEDESIEKGDGSDDPILYFILPRLEILIF
jgi:hypothetical protein